MSLTSYQAAPPCSEEGARCEASSRVSRGFLPYCEGSYEAADCLLAGWEACATLGEPPRPPTSKKTEEHGRDQPSPGYGWQAAHAMADCHSRASRRPVTSSRKRRTNSRTYVFTSSESTRVRTVRSIANVSAWVTSVE
jgi:hypothetical protein